MFYTCDLRMVNIHAAHACLTTSRINTMPASKKPIPPSRWWTFLARPLVRDYDGGFAPLIRELSKAVGRKTPWHYTALTRFVAKGECSADLAAAISIFFKLPRPAFLARSVQEAWEMEAVATKYKDTPAMSDIEAEIIEMEERLAEKRRQLEASARTPAKSMPKRAAK